MCIICASPKGAAQPALKSIATMFRHNPHGAGYMYRREHDDCVHIEKGFMTLQELTWALKLEAFTPQDSVVYHFRISTQAGVNAAMTHPFPLSNRGAELCKLETRSKIGIAHNGIIRLTSDPNEKVYSDTAIFIRDYMTKILHTNEDIYDQRKISEIKNLVQSKLAIMNSLGDIRLIGDFVCRNGIYYSNHSFEIDPWLAKYAQL